MGRYRKKPYKKKHLDPWHEWDLKDEIQYELNHLNTDEIIEEFFNGDEAMESYIDEPEIVKQLRKEEQNGIFPILEKTDHNDDEFLPEFKEYQQTPSATINTRKTIKSYEEAYQLAKKAFQRI